MYCVGGIARHGVAAPGKGPPCPPKEGGPLAKDENETAAPLSEGGESRSSSVVWNDIEMQTSFANVVNVQGTREQVEVFFGTNRSWNPADDGPLRVDLSNRVIMTPYAAKRLHQILTGVLREYEARHGILKVED